MDGVKRMATVRIGTPFQGDATPAVKFHLGDHLGSGTLAVAGSGAWISREEFTPYGETSFGGYARKRYRFAGKERDEESGLDYFGARYFAPWLARWTTCDPAGRVDGLNLYAYAANNPVVLVDPTGRQSSQGSAGGVDPAPPEPETSDTPVAQDTGGGPPHQSITSPGIEPEHREPEPEDADIPTVDVNDLPEATEHAPAGTFRNAPPGGVGEPEWTNPAWEEGTGPFIEGFKVGAEHAVINQAEGVAATAGGPAGALVGDPVSEELDSIKSDVPDVPNESGSVGWALGYTFTNAVLLFIGGRMVELGEPGGGGPAAAVAVEERVARAVGAATGTTDATLSRKGRC
jgi:RHS repeat-associated protein